MLIIGIFHNTEECEGRPLYILVNTVIVKLYCNCFTETGQQEADIAGGCMNE
jgi:hypothetical protein